MLLERGAKLTHDWPSPSFVHTEHTLHAYLPSLLGDFAAERVGRDQGVAVDRRHGWCLWNQPGGLRLGLALRHDE